MRIKLGAELWVESSGKLSAIRLFGKSKSARKTLEDLMQGKVEGLAYCEDRSIRPVSYGTGAGDRPAEVVIAITR